MTTKTDNLARQALEAAGGSEYDAKRIVRRAGLVSEVIAACAPEIAPYDFQASFIDDYQSRLTLWRKPRGIGGSWSFANKASGKQWVVPRSHSIFLSLNMDDAAEKITYCKDLYQQVKDAKKIPLPAITTDNKTEIGFSNGSTIKAVFDPRGKHKRDIYGDEFAHHPQARRIQKSVIPMLIRGTVQIAFGSTVVTRGVLFSQMWYANDEEYTGVRRISTYWWDAPSHCVDVAGARREAMALATEERVMRFGTPELKLIFRQMLLEDFQCEFELQELGEDDAWLPWDLILACTETADDLPNLTPSEFTRLMDNPEVRCYAGYDVGRVHDTGEFSGLVTGDGTKHVSERMAKTFRARSFQEQEDFLFWYLGHPRTFLWIDKGGMGMNTAEKLTTKFGSARVKEVDFGSKLVAPFEHQNTEDNAKTVLAVSLKQAMLNDQVRFQADVNKNYQMHSVRRAVTESLRTIYRVETEGEGAARKHHADVFWARAMAVHCWLSLTVRRFRFAAVA